MLTKNPHNTIMTFQEYEEHMDGHQAPSDKVIIVDKTTGDEEAQVQEEVHRKIYTDADYRKQLLLRVLPKFEKLEQFD